MSALPDQPALPGMVPGEYSEHALDRGPDDLGAPQHPGTRELVYVVDLGEPATIIRGAVVLQLHSARTRPAHTRGARRRRPTRGAAGPRLRRDRQVGTSVDAR